MAAPTIKVEVAFGYDSLETSPVWTDVSAYVRHSPPLRISRGRTSERGVFTAGTASLTFDNRDRRFDPTYTSGPYYGDLKPGVRIKVTATWSAVDYPMFTGWVTGWPNTLTSHGTDSTVSVDCVDGLAWLNRARVPEDIVGTTAFNFGDGYIALRATDDYLWREQWEGNDAALIYGRRAQSASVLPGSAAPAITFDGTTLWQLGGNSGVGNIAPAANRTLSFVMKSSQKPPDTVNAGILGNAVAASAPGSDRGFAVYLNDDGRLYFEYAGSSTLVGTVTTTVAVNDGEPHHIVLVTPSSGTSTVYIDGVAAPVTTGGTGAPYIGLSVFGQASSESDYADSNYQGSLQDVIVWGKALTAAEVSSLYDVIRGFVEESAADRVDRILDAVSWPSGWRDISTTLRSRCGRLVFGGRTGLDFLQESERTEQGYLFVAKDGDVTFLSRYWHQEDTRGNTSQATFSDDGAGIAYAGSFGFRYDDRDIRNDVVVNAEPVGRGRATDLVSAAEFGSQALQVNTVLTSSQVAADMASGLTFKYNAPNWRSQQMVVYPAAPGQPGSTWATVLGLELCDRITQEVTPMGVGPQIAKDMLLGRIEWIIDATDRWELSILGEPVPPSFFMIGTSTIGGPDYVGF